MTGLTRRELLRAGGVGAIALASGACRAPAAPLPEAVLALHRDCAVLDLHVDTPLWMRLLGYDLTRRHRNPLPGSPYLAHMDLPRAREGGLDGAVLGLVISPREVRDELRRELRWLARIERGSGIDQTLETLELLESTARSHPRELALCRSGSELRAAMAAGRFAALAGLEGSHGIESDLANVRRAWERGLRMIGLTHFQATSAAFPMTVSAFEGRGLTDFGRALVPEMERLGMAVDVAHVNEAGLDDVLALARRPLVLSHGACRALTEMPRATSDAHIRRIADGGGVIGLANGRDFVARPGVAGYVDQIEHVLAVGGADTPALGTDYDGAIVPVEGMPDVTSYPRVTAELLARGHDERTVRKILGGNALRVLTETTG